MNNRIVNIRCVHRKCKTLNSVQEAFCHRCNTPIVKNYLWIKGDLSQAYPIGECIDDRFVLHSPKILLDTKPSAVIPTPENIPNDIKPYLKLFSHRLHLPQIYGYLNFPEQAWLLEYESVPLDSQGGLIYPRFFPSIQSGLGKADALRQIHWLWQIVQLWTPLSKQNVLSSLFLPDNIRVNGAIVKLIELNFDGEVSPTLKDLGNLFCSWLPFFDDLIQDIINKIILCLQQDLLTDIEKVLQVLDQSIYILGNNYYQRKYELITKTDPGRKRKNNEDSCYPVVDNPKKTNRGLDTLSIVCDGLGGQEGGEVASSIAIDLINQSLKSSYKETLQKTLYNKDWTPLIDAEKIYKAISAANNKITKLNNAQKREKLQRMGTTATIGMAIAHEVYLANVGDSRIYWITPNSCHQVSIDDDVATKKVKKGQDLYRSIASNPKAGALLQALGMEFSNNLTVHIRRFILDQDSVFLLCSDGLSDFNRVEQYWRSIILPIIKQEATIEATAQQLMDIALKKNGHDNITIALLYCQVEKKEEPEKVEELSWSYLQEMITDLPTPQEKNQWWEKLSTFLPLSDSHASQKQIISLLALLVIIIFGGGVTWWMWSQKKSSTQQSQNSFINLNHPNYSQSAHS